MRESYVEDLASHGGPESCVGDPRGRSEALAGVHAGRLLSPEILIVWGADAVMNVEGNTAGDDIREPPVGPAGSENPLHACDLFMLRTGRSRACPCLSMMPRPGWFAGWQINGWRAARGTLWR
jgi:hypothetical protein